MNDLFNILPEKKRKTYLPGIFLPGSSPEAFRER